MKLGFQDARKIAFTNQFEMHLNRQGRLMHDPKARAVERDVLWAQLGPKFANLDERRVALYAEEALKCAARGELTDAEHEQRNASTVATVVKGFAAGQRMQTAAAEIRAHNLAHEPALHALLHFPGAPGLGSSPRVVADQLEQHDARKAAGAQAALAAGKVVVVPVKPVLGGGGR